MIITTLSCTSLTYFCPLFVQTANKRIYIPLTLAIKRESALGSVVVSENLFQYIIIKLCKAFLNNISLSMILV